MTTMIRYILLPLLLLSLMASGQKHKKKRGAGLYRTGDAAVDKGWYFGLGGTYMLRSSSEDASFSTTDLLNNTIDQNYSATPTGKFGLSADIGLFKMTDKKFINYIDYGLAYKWLRGGEDYVNDSLANGVLASSTEIEGAYSDHLISGHFNFGYRYDQSDKLFFVNGLGLNVDYHLLTSRTATPPIPELDFEEGPDDFLAELHYFFGVGFKTGKRLIVMPIVEIPIFSALPFDHINSSHTYFNTKSRPIIFKVRFMFLKKGSKSCPAVFSDPLGTGPKGSDYK